MPMITELQRDKQSDMKWAKRNQPKLDAQRHANLPQNVAEQSQIAIKIDIKLLQRDIQLLKTHKDMLTEIK